jgi:hypothetical protein
VQILWADGLSDAGIEAEVDRRRRAGTLNAMDKLLLISWKTDQYACRS